MTIALVTCSGISNTGKLTTQAAQVLLQRRPGQYVWLHAKQSAATLESEVGDADSVIVLDGCTDCCATKKLAAAGIIPENSIIATGLGIAKNGMAEVQFHEIETVIAAVIRPGRG
jgi:uncharacterized metal-binding protein|nr:putative zinc-binding protein [uncultured Methanoregula sp.]